MANADEVVRAQLLELLVGEGAHLRIADALADFPAEFMNVNPPNVPYTPWHLVEHIRFGQRDILDYIRNPDYVAHSWPRDYWPAPEARADEQTWRQSVEGFMADLGELRDMVADPKSDLYVPLPHAPTATLLRQMLLVGRHNSFHMGEFGVLRQVMGTWPPGHK